MVTILRLKKGEDELLALSQTMSVSMVGSSIVYTALEAVFLNSKSYLVIANLITSDGTFLTGLVMLERQNCAEKKLFKYIRCI